MLAGTSEQKWQSTACPARALDEAAGVRPGKGDDRVDRGPSFPPVRQGSASQRSHMAELSHCRY